MHLMKQYTINYQKQLTLNYCLRQQTYGPSCISTKSKYVNTAVTKNFAHVKRFVRFVW